MALWKKVNQSKKHIAIVLLASKIADGLNLPCAILPWGNSTLLGHAIKEVVKTQINDLYVVLGHEYDAVFERHKHFPVKFVQDTDFHTMNLSAISAGLTAVMETNVDGVLFLHGNQPAIDHLYLKKLIRSFSKGNQCMVATKNGNEVGLPAIFHPSYFNELIKSQMEVSDVFHKNEECITMLTSEVPFYKITDIAEYHIRHKEWFGEIHPL